jgi:hypothetical protein
MDPRFMCALAHCRSIWTAGSYRIWWWIIEKRASLHTRLRPLLTSYQPYVVSGQEQSPVSLPYARGLAFQSGPSEGTGRVDGKGHAARSAVAQ